MEVQTNPPKADSGKGKESEGIKKDLYDGLPASLLE